MRLIKTLAFIFVVAFWCGAPTYNSQPPIQGLSGPVAMWNAETPTPGNGGISASQQVALSNKGNATGFSCDGKFSGDPGAFEVDVQVAAVDADANYQTISNGNITTTDSVNNTFHIDAPSAISKFLRLLMRSRANSVSITATCGQ